jgi:asparagine synthase (glutamine-hydrolysing)
MCGIAGIISLNGKKIFNLEKRLKLMSKLLKHRGPDDSGYFISKKKNIGLSNNRLSIVSPDKKIKLPYTKNNKEYLSFNGEIYNYLFLKKELEKKGVKFSTYTDTEILYEFLRYEKLKKLEKLNGMWTFAFYDGKKDMLTLSRDLLGERHLFYKIEKNELIFSSEVEPILHASIKINEFDFESLVTSWKFNSCSPGKTLIKGIYRLEPATNLVLHKNKLTLSRFQKLHPEKWFKFFEKKPEIKDVLKKFQEIFSKEVNLRLPKDVKYTTALSGGIDSTILNYFISKSDKNNQTIFSLSEDIKKVKKLKDSDLRAGIYVAKKFNTKHFKIELLKSPESLKNLKYFAENCFDGCIDPTTANFAGLAGFAKKLGCKVMLFSDGVDELLGGYNSDIEANRLDSIFKKYPFIKFLLKFFLGKKILVFLLNIKINNELHLSYDPYYFRVNHAVCPDSFLKKIVKNYNSNIGNKFCNINIMYKKIIPKLDYSQIRALTYATNTIPDMYNLRIDKASMKYSVETRLPFQSKKLVEFFIAMPSEFRFYKKSGKYILRRFTEENIDNYIANRKKQGMGGYLWSSKKIKNNLNLNKTIINSDFFKRYPFADNIKNILLDHKTHPANVWAAYSFIKAYNKLNQINNLKCKNG